MRRSRFSLLMLVSMVFLMTIGGVFATWQYTTISPNDTSDTFSITTSEFEYTVEEVLPGDEEADKLGENHLLLIERILNEIDYGLNATKKPIMHNYLKKDGDIVYGNQQVSGGNLKHILIDGTTAEKLMFLVTRISATEYHAYTFSAYQSSNTAMGEYIEAYKTVLVKENGVWDASKSYLGKAKVFYSAVSVRSVDITTWVQT